MDTSDKLALEVERLKEGNNEAFTFVYEDSYKYLHSCVIHIVKDEDTAQDMLQDTYAEIFRNIGQLRRSEDFLSWAATIANRKCFAYIKKNREILVNDKTDDEGNESGYFDSVADDEAFIPENIFDNREKIKLIRNIIDDLSDVQRACIIGFYYNEQKQEEIAVQLGIPVNTVKSHLNRAKAKIKEAVGDVEKKQGVKLYSFAPFMLLLFGYEVKAFAAEMTVPAMPAPKTDVLTPVKEASSVLKTRIAICVAVLAVGTAAIGLIVHNKSAGTESSQDEPAEVSSSVSEPEESQAETLAEENFGSSFEAVEDETGASDSEPEEEDIPEAPIPDAEANHVEFADSITTDTPVWVIFTKKENEETYLNPDPDCTYKDARAFLELKNVEFKDSDDGNREYTITFTQDINYTLRYPTSYEHLYHYYYLEGLYFYDYYTGRKLNVTETSMDVGEMEKEGVTENIISWDGEEIPVTILVQKERESREGGEIESGGFYETTCVPYITFTYKVTCPKDYDGLCAYTWKPSKIPSDKEERIRKENYDESGKAIEKEEPDVERYLFKDEDDDGIIPTAEDLYIMRVFEVQEN